MSVGLDTSVVVRLLVGEPSGQADAARRALDASGEDGPAVSDLVVGETYFALRHHYAVPHGRALSTLRAFVADPRIRCTGVAARVLIQMPDRKTGPGLMDRLIHAGYEREDTVLLTFDRVAARLPNARLLGG